MENPRVDGELSLEEIQQGCLRILKEIDAVCRKENIRYWVMYGTLIGTVRHHGFIPWDDDLDIVMPRSDYERFLVWFREHQGEMRPLVALDGYRNELPFLITRISDTTYKMIGEYGDEVPNLGVFVDVYPFDGCGDTIDEARKHKRQCMTESRRYLDAGNFAFNNCDAGMAKRLLKRVRADFLGDPGKYLERLHELSLQRSFDDSGYVSCLVWDWEMSGIFPRSYFENSELLDFEGFGVPVPCGYDQILTADYGDYMQLPPEEERVGHHYYSIIKR